MAPVFVDPARVREFPTATAFEKWLKANHAKEPEVWIKIHKKGSGLPSITALEAIDVVLCWGWIDAIRKGFDDKSFLQRYTPRGKKSVWSKINVDNIARLTAAGKMQPSGQVHVDLARADGRWDRAYSSIASKEDHPELMAAIEAEPKALETFKGLSSQNRFALTFRTSSLKTDAGRQKKIAAFVEMLKRGETIYPQKAKAK